MRKYIIEGFLVALLALIFFIFVGLVVAVSNAQPIPQLPNHSIRIVGSLSKTNPVVGIKTIHLNLPQYTNAYYRWECSSNLVDWQFYTNSPISQTDFYFPEIGEMQFFRNSVEYHP